MTLLLNRCPRLFTVDELYRLIDAGILAPDERVELVEGEIVPMSPHDPKHSDALAWCNNIFSEHFGSTHLVRIQLSLRLSQRSELEPDLSLLPKDQLPPRGTHPTIVPFVLEVSNTSLSYDRGEKLKLYARAGIPEYWIVNVRDRVVEVHRDPQGDDYGDRFQRGPGDVIELLHMPCYLFPVNTLLGDP
ncbi:Uma2 family endonuclease [bacterium]|nr:Uma2 family endonuclease [bacterium]